MSLLLPKTHCSREEDEEEYDGEDPQLLDYAQRIGGAVAQIMRKESNEQMECEMNVS